VDQKVYDEFLENACVFGSQDSYGEPAENVAIGPVVNGAPEFSARYVEIGKKEDGW